MKKIISNLFILMSLFAIGLHGLQAQNWSNINNTAGIDISNEKVNSFKILTHSLYNNYDDEEKGEFNKDIYKYNTTGIGLTQQDANAIVLTFSMMVAVIGILSNDVYVYPVYSFSNYSAYGRSIVNGTNWAFGLRKTFKHSALEYGGNHYKYKDEFNNFDRWDWGFHLNFVHQVFYNKTPEWMKAYFGLSINDYFFDSNTGYGALVGTEIKIVDRLKFDLRFVHTTTIDQLQSGLIFTFQKKYLWQKK